MALGQLAAKRGCGIAVILDHFETIDHDVRGNRPTPITAHAVGHRPKLARRIGQDGILVLFADPPTMGQTSPNGHRGIR